MLFFINCWSNKGEFTVYFGPFASEKLADHFADRLERDGYTEIGISVLNPERNYPNDVMVDTF